MDTPESCGGSAGMGSVALTQSAAFQNLNTASATFLLAASGSATKATLIDLSNSAGPGVQTAMGIYAPFSTVNLSQSINLVGAVVAKQITAANTVTMTYDPLIQQLAEDPLFVYHRSSYLECTAVATSTTPDSGC
jgi:hypothetical protein